LAKTSLVCKYKCILRLSCARPLVLPLIRNLLSRSDRRFRIKGSTSGLAQDRRSIYLYLQTNLVLVKLKQ
jgi:hypothetical protein